MAVEEGAVDPGAAGDVGDAEFGAVGDGVVERGQDALAAAGGVGSTSVDHRVDGGCVAGHGVLSGRGSGRVWRVRGMPSMDAAVAADDGDGLLKVLSLFGFEFVQAVADLVDQAADAADLFCRRHGLGACPLVEIGGGE